MTVQELLDILSVIKDKSKTVVVSDDNDDKRDLCFDKETKTTVVLGQYYED